MALEQLAYEEAARAIDRQSGSLDGLRRRAGILLAAISLATSFFGGLVLGDGDLRTRVVIAAGFATAFGVLAGGLCVAVLWPRAEWAFNLGATQIVRQLDETKPDEATAYRELALRLHKNYQENRGKLESLFWRFRLACIALAVEAVAWVVALALQHGRHNARRRKHETSDESQGQTTESTDEPEPIWPDLTDRETRDAGVDDDEHFKSR